MRSPQQNLANAREELAHIKCEFTPLQKRIEAAQDSVADSLVRSFPRSGNGTARAAGRVGGRPRSSAMSVHFTASGHLARA